VVGEKWEPRVYPRLRGDVLYPKESDIALLFGFVFLDLTPFPSLPFPFPPGYL